MRICRRTFILLGILWLPPFATAQDAQLPSTEVAAVDEVALAEIANQKAIGLSIGVIQHGRIAYLKAYGLADREKQTPATTQTAAPRGSARIAR